MSRIIIADDHPLMRSAVRAAIEPIWANCEIVEVSDAAGARAEVDKGDVALMSLDLQMSDSGGLQTLLEMRKEQPAVPVVIVSANEETRIQLGAKKMGASAFIPKSAPLHVMREALQAVYDGDVWFEAADEDDGSAEDLARFNELTPAQRRVLSFVARGLLNKQIAHEMQISEATVKAHMTAIFRKLGVVNRTQAVLIANQLDVTSAPPAS